MKPQVRTVDYYTGRETWRGSLREFYRSQRFDIGVVRASDFATSLRERGWLRFGWWGGESFDVELLSADEGARR